MDNQNPSSVEVQSKQHSIIPKKMSLLNVILTFTTVAVIVVTAVTVLVVRSKKNTDIQISGITTTITVSTRITTSSNFVSVSKTTSVFIGTTPTIRMNNSNTNTAQISVSPTTASNVSCDISACRSVISYYLSRHWRYDTNNFGECPGCTRAVFPNYPANWLNLWYTSNIYIPTSAGQDCAANPYRGNISDCKISCLRDTTCVGFSSRKTSLDNNYNYTAECWLKNNITSNQITNDLTWETIIFNSTQ
ncbi:hypothetical protein I4U23_000872 [Adineta vaga]|nr:hypothetical protein I4U23_000872 [Adineta vaga]